MSRPQTWLLLLFLTLLLPLDIAIQLKLGAEGDKGWLFFAAQKLLAGGRFGVDMVEVNPPLIVWFYALCCWVAAQVSFLKYYEVMVITALALTGASMLLSLRLIEEHPAFAGDRLKQGLFGILLATLFITFTSPVYFFDREHIMLVLTFPYIMRFMPALSKRSFALPLRLAIGLLAAFGFLIKPHAALVFAGLQLLRLLRRESVRDVLLSAENLVVYLFGILYLTAIICFVPDYYKTVLPMVMAAYPEFNVRANPKAYLTMAFFAVLLIFADFRPRHATPYRRDVYYFAGVAVIYLGYTFVNHGWGYTFNPLFCTILFLTAWLAWEYGWLEQTHEEKGLPIEQFRFGRRACAVSLGITLSYTLISLVGLVRTVPQEGYFNSPDNPSYVAYLKSHDVHTFGLMSGEFTRWPEISMQSKAAWVTRFNCLWMVPALVKAGINHDDRLQKVRDYVANAYVEDIAQHRPEIVFVDNSDEFFTSGYHVDLPALFLPVPAFAKTWSGYRYETTLDNCKPKKPGQIPGKAGCRYDVYRRADLP